MWLCPECDEAIEDGFDACWRCGTDRAGNKDSDFCHADKHPAIYSENPPKREEAAHFGFWSAIISMISMISLSIIFGVIAIGGGPLLGLVLLFLGVTGFVLVTILHIYGILYEFLCRWIRSRPSSDKADPLGRFTEDGLVRECDSTSSGIDDRTERSRGVTGPPSAPR